MDSFLADINVYMRRHKSALFRAQLHALLQAILLAMNFRLFSLSDTGFSLSLKKGRFCPRFLQMSPKFSFMRDIVSPKICFFFC